MFQARGSTCSSLLGAERTAHSGDLAGNECSSSRSINLVVPVLGSNDDSVIADVVTLVANDEDLGGSDASEALVAISITKSDDCQDQYRISFGESCNLPALTLAAAAAVSLCVAV